MNDKRRIQDDKPYWLDKEPDFARLQMAVLRGAVIFGKDHVKVLKKFKQKEVQDGNASNL